MHSTGDGDQAKGGETGTRSIGTLGATVMLVGSVVGITIFILPGALAAITGPAVMVSYFLAAALAFFACVVAAQIGGAFPVSGGSYISVSQLISPFWGFAVVWMALAGVTVSISLLSYGFVDYFNTLWPGWDRRHIAYGLLLTLTALNVVGVKSSVRGQVLMVAIFLIALGAFCLGGVRQFNPALMSPFMPNGGLVVLAAAVPAYYSYTGFMAIVEVGGELKDPSRTIPRALVISFAIVLTIYSLVALSIVGNLPWQSLAHVSAPVTEVAMRLLPAALARAITLAALAAAAGSINALLLAYSRDVMAMSRRGLLPAFLGKVSARYGPTNAVLFLAALAAVALAAEATVASYATIAVFGVLILQILVALAAQRLPRRLPDVYARSQFRLRPSVALFFTWGLLTLSLLFVCVAINDNRKIAIAAGTYLLIGGLYYKTRVTWLARRRPEIIDAWQR